MAIGLNESQLMEAFLNAAGRRINEVQGQLDAASAGENPEMLAKIKEILSKNPQFANAATGTTAAVIIILVASFMDMIVANNEAIAKTIPHIEN
jgi:hypothetical protein